MKQRLVYILGTLVLFCSLNGYGQTTVYTTNCNSLTGWTNTGGRFNTGNPGITPNFTGPQWNFTSVDPIVPPDDHTVGGNVFYTNGNSLYAEAGAGSYVLYRLESPIVDLSTWNNCRLEFWVQMRCELPYTPTQAWDGAFVELSSNGGATWTKVTNAQLCPGPGSQYDGSMSVNGSSTPFNPAGITYTSGNTPSWYTNRLVWTRILVNISAFDFVPNFKFRFVFHSDEAANAQGWALDDIKVVSTALPHVEGNNITIPDNDITPIVADGTDFGTVGVGMTSTKTFWIHNTGEAPLTLTGTPMVTCTGTGFSISAQPSTSVIASGDSVSFDVTFAPLAVGVINGTVTINNSDIYSSCSAPSPYNYAIRANALIINTPPFILDPPNDTTVCPNTPPLNIPFTVGDNQQTPGSLVLSATSSNPAVIPAANIVFGGAGASRDVTLTPISGAVGSSTITITIDDGQPSNNDSTFSFILTLQDNTNPTAICQNVSVQLDQFGNGSITPAMVDNGSFDDCGINSISISQTNFTCADVGLQLVDFTVTDIVGNSSVCQFTVDVVPAPLENDYTTSDFNGFDVSCFGANDGFIQVQSSAGCAPYNYVWSHDPANNSNTSNGMVAGNYTVTVTDGAGQQEIIPITLTQPTALVDNSTSTNISCFGKVDGSINLNVSGGISPYLYSQGPQLNNIPAGNYNFIVTDDNNCTIPVNIVITEPAQITVTGVNEYFIYCGEEVQLNIDVAGGSGGFVYNWSNPLDMDCATCEDPIAKPNKSTVFTVEVSDVNGCNTFYSISAEVDCNVFIPNSFTPNQDELNPVFEVHVSNVQAFEMHIFDRWGEDIYTSTDKDKGWNGDLLNGNHAPEGVYVYDVYLIMPNGQEVSMRGMVNLIR